MAFTCPVVGIQTVSCFRDCGGYLMHPSLSLPQALLMCVLLRVYVVHVNKGERGGLIKLVQAGSVMGWSLTSVIFSLHVG